MIRQRVVTACLKKLSHKALKPLVLGIVGGQTFSRVPVVLARSLIVKRIFLSEFALDFLCPRCADLVCKAVYLGSLPIAVIGIHIDGFKWILRFQIDVIIS